MQGLRHGKHTSENIKQLPSNKTKHPVRRMHLDIFSREHKNVSGKRDRLWIRGYHNWSPSRRRAPSADAKAGVVQAAEEWAMTVDNAAAWSDVAPANSTKVEVAQYNNQPVWARGYITNNILIRIGTRARMREE